MSFNKTQFLILTFFTDAFISGFNLFLKLDIIFIRFYSLKGKVQCVILFTTPTDLLNGELLIQAN